MADGELIYEKEIAPSVSLHALNALIERIGDAESAREMLHVLSSYAFDIGGKTNFSFNARFTNGLFFSPLIASHFFFTHHTSFFHD